MKSIEVVCGIAMKDGKVFMARRRPEKSYGGHWELPGGKVEPGEVPQIALARELSEELEVEAQVGAFVATGVDHQPDLRIVLHGYLMEMASQPLASLDHDQMDWFAAEELGSIPIPPADLPILKALFALAEQ